MTLSCPIFAIPTILVFCDFFLFLLFADCSLSIIFNVDPIVYLLISIYTWAPGLTSPGAEIVNASNPALVKEGDFPVRKAGYLLPTLPPFSSSSAFHLSSPTNSCIALNSKHGPPHNLRDCWGTLSRQSYAQFPTQRLQEFGARITSPVVNHGVAWRR